MYFVNNIDQEKLKEWILNWELDADHIVKLREMFSSIDIQDESFARDSIEIFKRFANLLPSEEWYRFFLSMSSEMLYKLFFRVDNSSILIANYFECIIKPSDIKTKKKIISGYELDNKEFGEITLTHEGTTVGNIGRFSDMFWHVFYHDFVGEDENYIKHYIDHDEILSLKLWNIYGFNLETLYQLVDDILLDCSVSLGMNFRLEETDSNWNDKGEAESHNLETTNNTYERIPKIYFNNGFQNKDVRLSFLSYYQVIEFFYVRAQNNQLIEDLKLLDFDNIDHSDFRLTLKKYNSSTKEKASLKIIIQESLTISDFNEWLTSNVTRQEKYTKELKYGKRNYAIDITKSNDKVLGNLAERIYFFRCAIAHAKGDIDEYIAIPRLTDKEIEKELDLIRYIAFHVLKKYS